MSSQSRDNDGDTVVTTFVLSRAHHDALRAIAARQHRPMVGVLRHWIDSEQAAVDREQRAAA